MKRLLVSIIIIFIFSGSGFHSEETERPLSSDIQAALTLKILLYDKNLDASIRNSTVGVGICYKNTEKSKTCLDEMIVSFEKLKTKGLKIRDYDIKFYPIMLSSADALRNELVQNSVNVLFISCGISDVRDIIAITQEQKILSVVGNFPGELVAKGVSIGLTIKNGKPSILLNLESSIKEGRGFSAQFLSLVSIVK